MWKLWSPFTEGFVFVACVFITCNARNRFWPHVQKLWRRCSWAHGIYIVRISSTWEGRSQRFTVSYLGDSSQDLSRYKSLRTLETPSRSLGLPKDLDFLKALLPTIASRHRSLDLVIVYTPSSYWSRAVLNHVVEKTCHVCSLGLMEPYRTLDEIHKEWHFRLVHCVEFPGPKAEEVVKMIEHKLEA